MNQITNILNFSHFIFIRKKITQNISDTANDIDHHLPRAQDLIKMPNQGYFKQKLVSI